LGKKRVRKIVQVCGWLLWILGLLYASVGLANGQKLLAVFRDTTIQKHQFWDDGPARKAEAKVALFDLTDRFAALHMRSSATLGLLMASSTLLIVISRRKLSTDRF